MRKHIMVCFCAIVIIGCACSEELVEFEKNDLKVSVEQGDAWSHDFPLFLGIKKKNPPQMAIWMEDENGKYLSTLYVTHKIATQSWQAAGKNRRKEALPCWCYARNVQYSDGLYLPTKDAPFTDGLTGATPRGDFDMKISPAGDLKRFVIKMEVNHSTDFNDSYPKSAKEGEAGYSGGELGSGQPAVIYEARIDLTSGEKVFEASLIGHSSPDGSDGSISTDMNGLTTALDIVKRIMIEVQ